MTLLTTASIFDNFSEDEKNSIINKAFIRKYKKNHILIFQDSDIDMIYIVKSGLLKVFRMHEDKELILSLVGKNSIIGELELFSNNKSVSSVEVIEDAEIYSFSKDTFNEILSNKPQLLENIFKIYSARFRELNEHIQLLSFQNVFTRICSILLKLARVNDEGQMVVININQDNFGSMASTTRESVSKAFSDLKKEKIIEYSQKEIIVLDYDKLLLYANSVAH